MESRKFQCMRKEDILNIPDKEFVSEILAPSAGSIFIAGVAVSVFFAAFFGYYYVTYMRIGGDSLLAFWVAVAICAGMFVLAGIKRINPFFLTKIGESITVYYEGKALDSIEVCGKRVGRPVIKALPSLVRITELGNAGNFILGFARNYGGEYMANDERVIIDKGQLNEFIDFMKKFENIGGEEIDSGIGGVIKIT